MSKIDLDFYEKVVFQQILKKDNTFLAAIIDYLDKELFKNKDFSAIVDVIKSFYLERDAIPTHTELKARVNSDQLKTHLRKAIEQIRELEDNYNEDELIANTEYFIKQRMLENHLVLVIDERAEKKGVDLDEYQKKTEYINSISLIDDLGLDYFGDNESVIKILLEENAFISTGYKGIDECLGGGMFREGRVIYAICGETNIGKSLIVGNIATNVLFNNHKVLIITLEMSEKRYAKRLSGMLSGIALNDLKQNIEQYKEFITKFKAEKDSRLQIKEFPAKSVSAKHVAAYIKKLIKKKGFVPDLIVVDYCSLMKPSVTQPSIHAAIQYVIQETRGLSYVNKCPILTPMQLNRSSHKSTNPALDTLSGSWDSASDIDNIINLAQSDEDREANIIRYINVKSRDGKKGITGQLKVDYNTLRFYEEDSDNPVIIKKLENIGETIDMSDFLRDCP
jgi:replicative DNA helicase